jgi:hypothetical protein
LLREEGEKPKRKALRSILCRRPFDFRPITLETSPTSKDAVRRIKYWQRQFPSYYVYLSRDETLRKFIDMNDNDAVQSLTSALDYTINGLTTSQLQDLLEDVSSKQTLLLNESDSQIHRHSYNGLTTLRTLIQATIFHRENVQE